MTTKTTKPTVSKPPAIVIDTREQLPYAFEGYETVRGTLATGDYSLVGCENLVAVERKSKADAYQCVGAHRDRFTRCLERLAGMDRGCVVIECSLKQFTKPPSRTRIDAAMAVGSYLSWACKYRIPIFWAGDREYAERLTVRFLAAFLKYRYSLVTGPVGPWAGSGLSSLSSPVATSDLGRA